MAILTTSDGTKIDTSQFQKCKTRNCPGSGFTSRKIDDPQDPPPRYEVSCSDCRNPIGSVPITIIP